MHVQYAYMFYMFIKSPINLNYLMEAKVIFYGMRRKENLSVTGEHY